MTAKDKYVDVRYHMNTGKASLIVKKSAKQMQNKLRINRAVFWARLFRFDNVKYDFVRNIDSDFYKAKYRMECYND